MKHCLQTFNPQKIIFFYLKGMAFAKTENSWKYQYVKLSSLNYSGYLHGASWVLEKTRPLPSDLYTTVEESRLPLNNEVMP